ncbi:MAG: hypothetical protein LBH16_01940 [Treponema sp.]|jgi:hypothetical protein|nr:hypothetical protein [Treponema sp.]
MDYDNEDLYVHTAYDWIDNGAGELMLVMDKTAGMADDDNARILYDGFHEAMLIKNGSQIVHLPLVAEAVREMLEKLEKILVTEMDGEDIDDVYEAQVVVLNSPLPIPGAVYIKFDKLK